MRIRAALLFAAIAVAGEPLESRLVRGRVLGEDGEPVRGAVVLPCEGDQVLAESAADGTFALEAAPGAELEIRATAPGYATAWFRGEVRGEEPRLELRVRRGASLRVRVRDGTGRPVAGATVGLFPAPRVIFAGCYPTWLRIDRAVTTGSDGSCELAGLAERHYQVAVASEGWGRASAPVLCGTPDLRFVLRGGNELSRRYVYFGLPGERSEPAIPAGAPDPPPPAPAGEAPPPEEGPEPEPEPDPTRAEIRVRVVSADGVPVPRVDVTLSWAAAGGRGLAEGSAGADFDGFEFTDEKGRARLVLEPGRYRWEATGDFGTETASAKGEVEVRKGERREMEIRLASVFSVPVEVFDADGSPLPSVALELQRGGERDRLRTGPDGRATIFADREKALRILAAPEGMPTAPSGPLRLPVEAPVVLRIPRQGAIAGRVLDPEGTPLFGVLVACRREGLEPPDEEEWTAWTDDRGEFSCTGPSEGSYTVAGHAFAYRETPVRGVAVATGQPVEIRLRRMPRIRGRVVGTAGEPLGAVLVECDEGRAGVVLTAADGSFILAYRLAASEATLSFRLEGFEPAERKVDPERAADLEVGLRPMPPK